MGKIQLRVLPFWIPGPSGAVSLFDVSDGDCVAAPLGLHEAADAEHHPKGCM